MNVTVIALPPGTPLPGTQIAPGFSIQRMPRSQPRAANGFEVIDASAGVTSEDSIVRLLFPEIADSRTPPDIVRKAEARRALQAYRMILLAPYMERPKEVMAVATTAKECVEHRREMEGAQAKIAGLESDLRAVREGRGVYENKRLTECEAAAEKAHATIATLTAEMAKLTKTLHAQRAELTGREVQAAGYERSIQELTTAALHRTQAINTRQEEIAGAVRGVLELFEDRWPNANPFTDLIKEQLRETITIVGKPI